MENTEKPRSTKKDSMAITGFSLGIASFFLGTTFSILPILAIVFSGIGLGRTKEKDSGKWMAVSGLILGIVYFVTALYVRGYFG